MCRMSGTDHEHGVETHNGVHRGVRGLVVVAATIRSPEERVKPGRHVAGTLQHFCGPGHRRVHHTPDAHRYFPCVERIHGVELGLGVVHGTLGGHLAADGGGGQDDQIVGHTSIRVLPCSLHRGAVLDRCYVRKGP